MVWISSICFPSSRNTRVSIRETPLFFCKSVSCQDCSCLHVGPISSHLFERHSELKLDGARLERRRGVDSYRISSQVLDGGLWIEPASDLPCEPADPDLVHEVVEPLAGLQLVLPQHVLGQLG